MGVSDPLDLVPQCCFCCVGDLIADLRIRSGQFQKHPDSAAVDLNTLHQPERNDVPAVSGVLDRAQRFHHGGL